MKMNLNAVLLGTESRMSSKGNEYQTVLFGQGTDTLSCILKLEHPVELSLYKPCNFSIEYDTRWKQFKCVGIELCK